MGAKSIFQQILEEKMGYGVDEMPAFHSDFAHSTEENKVFLEEKSTLETLMATLLKANVNFKFHFSPEHVTDSARKVRTSYGVPPPREKRQTRHKNAKTVLVKDLIPEGKQALCTLIDLGATELKSLDLLAESIVKRAFRRLALRLHPDQNPNGKSRDFVMAHTAYSVLLSAFAKI